MKLLKASQSLQETITAFYVIISLKRYSATAVWSMHGNKLRAFAMLLLISLCVIAAFVFCLSLSCSMQQ